MTDICFASIYSQSTACLLFPSVSVFLEHKFLIFLMSILARLFFIISVFCPLFNKSLINSISQRFSPMHLSMSFIVLVVGSMIHFSSFLLIKCHESRLIFLIHRDIQLFQHICLNDCTSHIKLPWHLC